MSSLTVELLGVRQKRRTASRWPLLFDQVANRLVSEHGLPRLGNYRNPVREIFYIMLSAKTTDAQYRKTYRNLHSRFGNLAAISKAPIRQIRSCIESGGLAAKRAMHIKKAAVQLLKEGGRHPSRTLRAMSYRESFDFITGLPGMGPKSALCVLMYSLDADAFPVDVNVQRISERLGAIPRGLSHVQSQRRLAVLVPDGRSRELHVGMVVHGRKVCLPRKPLCGNCALLDLCQFGRRVAAAKGASRGN